MTRVEEVDALVIGGNMRGLVAAQVLDALGFHAVLIESSPALGGADASFAASDGTLFEFGMHVLDEHRSLAATRLFERVLEGQFHRVELCRAIVLQGQVMPYAPRPGQMPDELRRLLPAGELIDELGDRAPTREHLAECYGRPFVDLVFDQVLPSFPSENRHRAFGVDESLLSTNIYPWFFPRAKRKSTQGGESRAFHDRLRAGVAQHILYPRRGGFGGFCQALASHLDPRRIEVLVGARDHQVELEPGAHTVGSVRVGDRRFQARQVFWAAAWPQLCELLALPCQEVATDRIVIGSFRLDRPVRTDYHEILVGDPQHCINRIYFPAKFRESDEPLMQVEFVFPVAEDWPIDADHWRSAWTQDLTRLGLLEASHQVELFDFKTRRMHFNAFGMEGVPLVDADPGLLHPESNLHPIAPSMANLNLNAHIPRTIAEVTAVMTETRAARQPTGGGARR